MTKGAVDHLHPSRLAEDGEHLRMTPACVAMKARPPVYVSAPIVPLVLCRLNAGIGVLADSEHVALRNASLVCVFP
jgi:hypothetical protein